MAELKCSQKTAHFMGSLWKVGKDSLGSLIWHDREQSLEELVFIGEVGFSVELRSRMRGLRSMTNCLVGCD